MAADQVLRLREDDLTWRVVDGEVVLLDGRDWSYLSVNPTGERLWRRLADGATVTDLEDELTRAFGIDRERARSDVERFLAGLRQHDLLEG